MNVIFFGMLGDYFHLQGENGAHSSGSEDAVENGANGMENGRMGVWRMGVWRMGVWRMEEWRMGV